MPNEDDIIKQQMSEIRLIDMQKVIDRLKRENNTLS